MRKTVSVLDIKNHINTDIRACDALIQLLEDERNALQTRDTELLDNIIKDKIINLQQLEASAKQRSEWVSFGSSSTPVEQRWLELLQSTKPSLSEDWQALKEKLKRCQEQNEVNGKVLARNQQASNRILSVMRGQGEPQHLYTQGGDRSTNSWQQTLGEA